MQRGELKSALADTNLALQQYDDGNTEWAWRFKILKAQILVSQSDSKEALALLRGDLPASLSTTDIAVRKLMVEGISHRYAQQFERAQTKLSEAEHLARLAQPQMLPEVLNNRGALEVDTFQYQAAQQYFDQALFLARQGNDQIQEAGAFGNSARLLISERQFDQAAELSRQALQLSRARGLQTMVATNLGNEAWANFQLGDFDGALDSYKKAVDASDHTDLNGYKLYWRTGVVNTFLAEHDDDSAENLAKSTLKLARDLDNSQIIAECLNDLTEIELRNNRVIEAEKFNREARQLAQAGLDHFGTRQSLLLSARIEIARQQFSRAQDFLQRVLNDPNAETPVQWEAERDLATIKEQQGHITEADRGYRQALDRIEASRSSINHEDLRMSFLSTGIEVYGDYIDFLIRHGKPSDALNLAELSRSRTLAEGLAPTNGTTSPSLRRVPPQQVAKKSHASLLFYWIGQKNSYLWIITPAKTSYFVLPAASQIDPLVADYRKALLRMHDAQDDGSAEGEKLFAVLVEPAKKLIPPGSHVIVLPSESLYGLNFETLVVSDPQPHFWIEDVTLTTGSSLTMLAASVKRPALKGKTLFLVGDTKPPNPPFAPLPQAAEEMKQVRKYFPAGQTRVLEGDRATPSAFLKSNPEQFSYLHFVTHGTASHTRPLESAVILSQEGDSYKLYARDIVQHRLNASLVTISACNGAGTRAFSGEGLVGLSWAFLRAGAHNVIGALWEVSDASTPQLMDAFYRELFQGKDPATALRDAKLGLLRSADPDSVFRKPFYWAPFQLYAGS